MGEGRSILMNKSVKGEKNMRWHEVMKKGLMSAAGALAAVSMIGVTAFADEAGSVIETVSSAEYASVTGGTVKADNRLSMRSDANVPNVTYTYTIANGTAQTGETDGDLPVYAGSDKTVTNGMMPTLVDAGPAASESDKSNKVSFAVGQSTKNSENGKYADSSLTVDFSKVEFKEPGVYRYVLTQEPTKGVRGIVDDTDPTRVLDVYVENASDQTAASPDLKVAGYVLSNVDEKDAVKADGTSQSSTKKNGWQNSYNTVNLTIKSTVSGNQASRDRYFRYTVTISGAAAGTKYDVDLSNADSETKTNGFSQARHTNPSSITAGKSSTAEAVPVKAKGQREVRAFAAGALLPIDDQVLVADAGGSSANSSDAEGTVTQDFWLRHGQSITIKGLPKTATYSVTEDKDDLDQNGYTASLTDKKGDTLNGDGSGSPAVVMDSSTKVADGAVTEDTALTIDNHKEGAVPTGILIDYAPYIVGIVLAAAAVVVLTVRKKRQ